MRGAKSVHDGFEAAFVGSSQVIGSLVVVFPLAMGLKRLFPAGKYTVGRKFRRSRYSTADSREVARHALAMARGGLSKERKTA